METNIKFEVGDFVTITKSKEDWVEQMDKYVGKTVKIIAISILADGLVRIIFDNDGGWTWIYNRDHFRKATRKEIKEYNRLDKPYDVTSLDKKEFVLPDRWHIVVTAENQKVVSKWRSPKGFDIEIGNIVGICDNTGPNHNPATKLKNFNWDFGEEITFDQFKKYVLKENSINIFPEDGYCSSLDDKLIDFLQSSRKLTGSNKNSKSKFVAWNSINYWFVSNRTNKKGYELSYLLNLILKEMNNKIAVYCATKAEWDFCCDTYNKTAHDDFKLNGYNTFGYNRDKYSGKGSTFSGWNKKEYYTDRGFLIMSFSDWCSNYGIKNPFLNNLIRGKWYKRSGFTNVYIKFKEIRENIIYSLESIDDHGEYDSDLSRHGTIASEFSLADMNDVYKYLPDGHIDKPVLSGLPPKWCIAASDTENNIIGRYFNENSSRNCYNFTRGYYHNINHNGENIMKKGKLGASFHDGFVRSGFVEITLKKFKKYVLINRSRSLTVDDLVENQIYKTYGITSHTPYLIMHTQNGGYSDYLDIDSNHYSTASLKSSKWIGWVFELPSEEEEKWFKACIRAGKFIPKDQIEISSENLGQSGQPHFTEEAVLQEAKKRYPIGCKVKLIGMNSGGSFYNEVRFTQYSYYSPQQGNPQLYVDDGLLLFSDGKWAEISKSSEYDDILEEAKKRYPIGTRFVSVLGYGTFKAGNNWDSSERGIFNNGYCVYRNGKWADIVEESKEESSLILEAKKRYPIGTKFCPAHMGTDIKSKFCIITNQNFREDRGAIYALTDEGEIYNRSEKYGNTLYDRVVYTKDTGWAVTEELEFTSDLLPRPKELTLVSSNKYFKKEEIISLDELLNM